MFNLKFLESLKEAFSPKANLLKFSEGQRSANEDYMLYALLNGGAPYLCRDAAYPNIDGAFVSEIEQKLEDDVERCRVVASLHEKVAKQEMIRHEILENGNVQRTTFADGTQVTVNFETQSYEIR